MARGCQYMGQAHLQEAETWKEIRYQQEECVWEDALRSTEVMASPGPSSVSHRGCNNCRASQLSLKASREKGIQREE
jgi:hypothetical protein